MTHLDTTIVKHGEESELRQAPETGQWWQDSAFISWYDPDAGIGGMMRIGHEPNYEGGRAALWFGIVTKDGPRFRRNVAVPLTGADLRDDGFGALDGHYRMTYDGVLHIAADDEDCQLELDVVDFYDRTHFFAPSAGSLSEDFASSHFECSGRVSGSVRLGDRRYAVEGLCHRDRSWGVRRWDTLLNSRWVPGTFGPDLSFGSIAWHAVDGTIRQYGYVVRDGDIRIADSVDITVTMEADGLTYRAGRAEWTFADSEVFVVDCAPIHGILTEYHGVGVIDTVCELERDGRKGFCNLEVSTNPRAGRAPVTTALRAVAANGLKQPV